MFFYRILCSFNGSNYYEIDETFDKDYALFLLSRYKSALRCPCKIERYKQI